MTAPTRPTPEHPRVTTADNKRAVDAITAIAKATLRAGWAMRPHNLSAADADAGSVALLREWDARRGARVFSREGV